MSEPLPNHENPLPTAEAPIAYRPISGWAVAGFAAGGVFAFLTLLCTIVALSQGAPMFFPIWIVGLAILGIVLSLLGQHEVQNSEGTRAGAKLARAGLWLSVISGLCYLSYFFFTSLAIESQADDFLLVKSDEDTGFFPRLREGATDPVQLNQAFLLTVPANQRSARPDNEETMSKLFDTPNKDGGLGGLSLFKNGLSPGVNGILPSIFFKQGAKDVKIEVGPVQEWEYKEKSYKVRRKYRFETKEVVLEMTLLVASTEAEAAGQGRRWYLVMQQSHITSRHLTRYGEGMAVLRRQARRALENWIGALNQGQAFDRIKEYDKTDWDGARAELRNQRTPIHRLFEGKGPGRLERFQPLNGSELGRWEDLNGRIRIYQAFRFGLPKGPGSAPAFVVDAVAAYETERDNVKPADTFPDSPPLAWKLSQIVFANATPVSEKKGGG